MKKKFLWIAANEYLVEIILKYNNNINEKNTDCIFIKKQMTFAECHKILQKSKNKEIIIIDYNIGRNEIDFTYTNKILRDLVCPELAVIKKKVIIYNYFSFFKGAVLCENCNPHLKIIDTNINFQVNLEKFINPQSAFSCASSSKKINHIYCAEECFNIKYKYNLKEMDILSQLIEPQCCNFFHKIAGSLFMNFYDNLNKYNKLKKYSYLEEALNNYNREDKQDIKLLKKIINYTSILESSTAVNKNLKIIIKEIKELYSKIQKIENSVGKIKKSKTGNEINDILQNLADKSINNIAKSIEKNIDKLKKNFTKLKKNYNLI